jgi:hypothetical protein
LHNFYLFYLLFQEIRQQIPARVKTPWNLVFIFPFFLVGLLFRRPAPSQLLRVRVTVSLVMNSKRVSRVSRVCVACVGDAI